MKTNWRKLSSSLSVQMFITLAFNTCRAILGCNVKWTLVMRLDYLSHGAAIAYDMARALTPDATVGGRRVLDSCVRMLSMPSKINHRCLKRFLPHQFSDSEPYLRFPIAILRCARSITTKLLFASSRTKTHTD